jgi:WD40 repeat protein
VWEKRSGECLHTLRDHTGPVNTAVWCSDGSLVATAGADRDIHVYDMEVVTALGARGGPGYALGGLVDDDRILAKIRGYPGGVGAFVRRRAAAAGQQAFALPPQCFFTRTLSILCLRLAHSLADGHVGPIRRLLWGRGDDTLLSCSDDAKIKVRT